MDRTIIQIPDSLHNSDHLYEILHGNNINQLKVNVELDFKSCKKSNWNTELEVILIIFIGKLLHAGKILKYIPPADVELYNFLEKSNFRTFIKSYENQPMFIDLDSMSVKRYFRVVSHNIDGFINWFCQEIYLDFPDKDLTMLSTIFAELMNNVYDHSNDELGAYVCWDFLNDNILDVTIGDFGIGIPQKVLEYFHDLGDDTGPKNAEQAMRWALSINNTTKSTHRNQGKGLDIVRSSIENTPKASLIIHSGVMAVHLMGTFGGEHKLFMGKSDMPFFKGTLVRIIIDINELPPNESFQTTDIWGM
jgi:anti-sigma regulatory factor (Ser/Thr protein kinase)